MNISNQLPFDNLYKVVAISGVLLVVWSTSLYFLTFIRAWELYREYKQGAEIIIAKTNAGQYDKDIDSDKNGHVENRQIDIAKLTKFDEELNFINEWEIFMKISFILCLLIGILLCFFGFMYWYQRVQKYQDMLLKKKATEIASLTRRKSSMKK